MAYPLGTVTQLTNGWLEVITTSGTWTAPTDGTNGFHITNLQVLCIGGGGGGGKSATLDGGGGGGGGALSILNSFSPTAGTGYTATVGAAGGASGSGGDTSFVNTSTVLAKGGTKGGDGSGLNTPGTAGPGGAAASGVGDVKHSGAAGTAGGAAAGGTGGGAGGPSSDGSGTTAGTGTFQGNTYQGAGGASAAVGSNYGGGGGGNALSGGAGSAGGAGIIVLFYNRQYAKNPTESVGAPTDAVTRATTIRRAVGEGLGATTSTYAATVLADSPKLYWKLNETGAASSTYADSSGNSNTGSQYLVAAQSVDGAIVNSTDTAIHLNDQTNCVIFAGGYNPWVAGAVRTYEMWLWLDRSQIQQYPMGFSGGHGAGVDSAYCFWGTGGASGFATLSVNFSPKGNASGRTIQGWINAIPPGPNGNGTEQWVHQVLVHDDSAKTATLYINGVSQGQKTGLDALSSNDVLRLAHWFESSTVFGKWQGKFDEVAVYETALSATQIKNHYLAGIANQVSDSVARQYTANRSASESISAPTDAVTRAFFGARTNTESINAPTDSVARSTAVNRATAETIDAPTDDVTRQFTANRNLTENINTPTDAVARAASFNRTETENVDAPTDTVDRQTDLTRNATENVDAPTDSVARHASFNRNPTEVLPGEGGGTTIINVKPTFIFDE